MVAYHTFLRKALRREKLPAAALWLMAADGTATWLRAVAKTLAKHLGDREQARRVLTAGCAPAFRRRYAVLREGHGWLPLAEVAPRSVALAMHGLYRTPSFARISWVLDGVGGPARGPRDAVHAWELTRRLTFRELWYESATHLGELLIVLTQELPKLGVPRTNSMLGGLCHDAGRRYAETMKRGLSLPTNVESAIEVLRVGEYIFRVNPEHETGSDLEARTGFIVGNACPWYTRPGWGGEHCGIFGQFQSGICSAFDLSYRLTKTIPRHGGDVCRVDLRPLRIRRSARS